MRAWRCSSPGSRSSLSRAGQVAGETAVAEQLPYLISGGFSGFGLVVVGVLVIAVQARRQDAAARSRQLDELRDLLDELPGGHDA